MRLKELQLLKYGPFEDQVLRFPGRAPGLHIIFGQNEAGKSSALRGLKALLFGIARNTSDDFLFGNDLLSVGAVLQSDDGRECELQRWKAKPTLRDKNNKALTDTSFLARCLGGMDETSFERFYGLDYDELQEGSKMLLQEKGNVGTSIFSAGLGALDVRKVLTDLEEKAGLLFKAKAKNPTLNKLISDYNQKKSEIKAASLTVKVFQEKEEERRKADRDLECLQISQQEVGARKSKLERIRRTRSMIAELNDFEMQLKDLGELVSLPDGFIAGRQQLSARLSILREEIAERTLEQEVCQSKIKEAGEAPTVLAYASAITDLQKSLQHYKNARKDLPVQETILEETEREITFILKSLRPDVPRSNVETLRLRPDQIAKIKSLRQDEKSLRSSVETISLEADELKNEFEQIKSSLTCLPALQETEKLSALIAAIQREGNLEAQLVQERSKLDGFRDATERALKRLQFWNGSLEDLVQLKIPGSETLADFQRRMQQLEGTRTTVSIRIENHRNTIFECHREIEELKIADGNFFTAKQLQAARVYRERAWRLVRREWLDSENVADEVQTLDTALSLPDIVEKAIREADAIADNRFDDATRISHYEDRHRRIEVASAERDACELERSAIDAELKAVQAEWHERWSALEVDAGTIAEMRSWISSRDELVHRFEKQREHTAECAAMESAICRWKKEISGLMAECNAAPSATNASLQLMIEHAKLFCKEQEELDRGRKKLLEAEGRILREWRKKIASRDHAKTQLDEWKESWALAVAPLNLRPDALVAEVDPTLAKNDDLFKKFDRIPETQRRVAAMTATIQSFVSETLELAGTMDPSLAQWHPDQIIEILNDRLIKARSAEATVEILEKQRHAAVQKKERALAETQTLKLRLDDMCSTAECGEIAELEIVERRFLEQQRLQKLIDDLKKSILHLGDGRGLSDLISEVNDIPFDELETQYTLAETEIENRNAEIQSVYELRARLKTERDAMDGKANAADAAAQAQCIVAQIRDESEQYVRLRMAAELLRREIDRYREENQTPLLRHASAIFAKLTCGGYSGVRADLDELGRNALMSIRKDGRLLGVEGMSDGTRDQLYLALRLAFLPLYLEKEENEPLPFVIDDVLINFDDTRCAAAFKFLYETSARVQVIVFTHHKHIVDLAKHALPEATCQHESLQTLEVFSFGSSEG